MRRRPGVILDLIVPTGTPALRLGELAPIKSEQEVLLIDAQVHRQWCRLGSGFVREA